MASIYDSDEPLVYDPMVADALIQRYRIKGATQADYAGAVHILLSRGRSTREVAFKLGLSDRTVQRYKELNVKPETEVAQTYCNCESHEYNTKRGYYSRDRKECTA